MVKYIITISWADLHAQKKMSFTIFDLYPFIQQIIYRSIQWEFLKFVKTELEKVEIFYRKF
jgi:hypothetical protein